jgi:DNA repair protein RadC
MGALEQEEMRVLFLDVKSQVLGLSTIYRGSLHTAWLRVGELFREAVRRNCAAIIVVHNHPSGDPTPSPDDVKITQEIVKAGELLGIEVLDHLIIGSQRYISLKDRGLGFE